MPSIVPPDKHVNWPTAIVLSVGLVVYGSFAVLEATGHHVAPALWAPLAPLGMFITAQMKKLLEPNGGDS